LCYPSSIESFRLIAIGLFGCCLLLQGATAAESGKTSSSILFSESFEDPDLLKRGWYDGSKFFISDLQPFAGKGCVEYTWKTGGTTPANSSGVRRLFEPGEAVALRCYVRLSK